MKIVHFDVDGDSYEFRGLIDEVAIYSKVLTLEEIEQHYNNGLAGKGYCYVAPKDAVDSLIDDVEEIDLPQGIENSLISKLENALQSLEKANNVAAANQLEAFIREVKAQQGKTIATSEAVELIEKAQDIIDNI